MENIADEDVVFFTDGSSIGNPGPAGSACVMLRKKHPSVFNSQSLGVATNNQAELWAIGLVFDEIDSLFLTKPTTIHCFTDSTYVIDRLTTSKHSENNISLINWLRDYYAELENNFAEIIWHWIPGHNGVQANEQVDDLALEQAKFSKLTEAPQITFCKTPTLQT